MQKTLLILVLAGATALQAADVPNDADSIAHALNRLAYGPRPGDVERVRKTGLAQWIEQQLNAPAIDDSAVLARLPQIPAPPATATPQELQRFSRQQVQTLAAQKVLRAVYSERQLEEVLVDFWFNHFNVFAGKGRTAVFLPEYERNAIRPHVWGRFRDMLGATAKSPAMLFYLDNWLSADPEAGVRLPRRSGLNENYARELMELHTLGVDGGYTQQDIVEVARAFTGWTIGQPRPSTRARGAPSSVEGRGQRAGRGRRQAAQPPTPDTPDMMMMAGGGSFQFTAMLHDRREKVVLGRTIPAGGGLEDGERVLDIVAAHPSTARHIAAKLVRRFVSDDAPEALVARVAGTFARTGGNLREVVREVVTSPEFFAAANRGAKMKTPLEFVVSAVRETGRDVADGRQIVQALQQLGMMPYMCEPPTGYDDAAETWITAGALVTRVNIAQRLAPQQAARIGGPEFQRR